MQLPYFMNELSLTELDMGCSVPQIAATSVPKVNHRGEWRLKKSCSGGEKKYTKKNYTARNEGRDDLLLM